MTIDFILHGVPNGHDIWGVGDDSHYFSTFYRQKDEKEHITIEARKVAGKSYCYYNYLKYNNVTASDGRGGSYLGITLRFDAYYKDILNIYQIFEIVYKNLIDTIITRNGDNTKFIVSKYEDAELELNEIKKKVINLIKLSATSRDFTIINNSFHKSDVKTLKAFLLDCTQENVLESLIKHGKVEISKFHPSINEIKKTREMEKRCNDAISKKEIEFEDCRNHNLNLKTENNKLQNTLTEKDSEINRLNKVIAEKEITITKLEAENKIIESLKTNESNLNKHLNEKSKKIKLLENELSQYKDSQKVSEIVKEIKKPLNTLAEIAGRQSDTLPTKNDNLIQTLEKENNFNNKTLQIKRMSIWKIIITILLFLILTLSLYLAYNIRQSIDSKIKKVQTSTTESHPQKKTFMQDFTIYDNNENSKIKYE